MTTPEKKVKDWIKERIKKEFPGCYIYMPVPNGYGMKGIPDFVICIDSVFVAIEAKSKEGMEPTKLQHQQLVKINAAGGYAICIDGKNEDKVEELVRWIKSRKSE